ncbi:hypothetical protein [Streptomyces sp. NPDC048623]|uniref:hypothetical protein n=1 Tax=Streptomyces sp. NPDC048623 TaxID=3155761 RepID=UPI0034261F18
MPDELVLVSGRVRKSIRRRLKLYAAEHDIKLQVVLDEALDEYLTRREAADAKAREGRDA